MSDARTPAIGSIGWRDLTVHDAVALRDFYSGVVGWTWRGEDMDGYQDFSMIPPEGGEPVAGVCHARGANADLPPQWLIYVVVEDVDESAARAAERGGTVVAGPRGMGGGRFAVIRDPAGAVFAIYAPPSRG